MIDELARMQLVRRGNVCIMRMLDFVSVVVNMWGSVRMFVVYRALLKIVVRFTHSEIIPLVLGDAMCLVI